MICIFIGSLTMANQNDSATAKQRRQFLFNLGFEDVPAIIQGRLERGEYTHELNRRQMIANMVSYETLNASRELAIFIFEQAQAHGLTQTELLKLAEFTAKMIALKPLSPPIRFPSEIMNMPADEKRDGALATWLAQERRLQMEAETRKVTSDISEILWRGEIEKNAVQVKRVYNLVSTIVDRMYLQDLIGNTKYFGRALAALLIREEKLHPEKGTSLSDLLREELKERYNIYLENYIGDTMVIPTQKGTREVKIQNGTMMLTRNLSSESLTISIAAIPKNLRDRWKARFQGLVGNPLAAPFFVTPEDTKEGISLSLRIKDRIAQSSLPIQTGLSHIVYFQIREDAETGIKMPRVIDNYPSKIYDYTGQQTRTGGTRFTYAEQVINPANHSVVYIAQPDPVKLQKWTQESVQKFGYNSEFFPSIELELSKTYPIKNDRSQNWKTAISEKDFYALHAEVDPNILSQNIWKRFTNGLEKSVYQGWTFHWPDPYDFYMVCSAYCSQTGDMAMRSEIGVSLEQHNSVWHWGLRALALFGNTGTKLSETQYFKKLGQLFLKIPMAEKSAKMSKTLIIAPSTLVVQPYMKGGLYRLESKSPEQRVQSSYMQGEYREFNHRTTQELNRVLTEEIFSKKTIDPHLEYGAALRDFEYAVVIRASNGIKTLDFSEENIAQIGAQKALPTMLKDWKARGYPNANACLKYFH